MSGRLQSDPLFQGLTRPAMVFGVTYMFFIGNLMVNLLVFINTSNLLVLFVVFPAIHTIGYIVCLKEPRIMEMVMVKLKKGMKCLNRVYHGNTNSYDLY